MQSKHQASEEREGKAFCSYTPVTVLCFPTNFLFLEMSFDDNRLDV